MRKKFLSVLALGLSLGLGLIACSHSTNPESKKLTLTGSSTVAPLASEIAKKFNTLKYELMCKQEDLLAVWLMQPKD